METEIPPAAPYEVKAEEIPLDVVYEDSDINAAQPIVDDEICKMADIRKSNGGKPILHASVSAKYTMRSDRAQNSRTEALNLIRNRKGHLPHIVVVTAEPMPNRLASLALGTGDIDCVYHFALYELIRAVKEAGSEDAVETLETLVQGKRLKDISDLPLDLSVQWLILFPLSAVVRSCRTSKAKIPVSNFWCAASCFLWDTAIG